jgi:predicted secreted protein
VSKSGLEWLEHELEDERSKRVIFVSHCLLNENTRYLGGAFRRGCVDELVDRFQQEGLGIYQMRCPEQRAWGGMLKRALVPLYGCKGTLLYRLRRILLPVFLLYTRHIYRHMAKEVVNDIEDYVRSGFSVAALVGVGGSPSCGVCTTLDLKRSIEVIASCPLAEIKRETMNDEAIASCLVEGEGLFMKAIRRQLEHKHIPLTFMEHKLLCEMRGQASPLQTQVLPGRV